MPDRLRLEAARQLLPAAARTLALALAVTGVVELFLFRVAAPVMSHVPATPGGSGLADAVWASGASALRATAVMVPFAAVALAVSIRRDRPRRALLLLAAGVATMIQALVPGAVTSLVVHSLTLALVVGVVTAAARTLPPSHAAGVGLVGVALVAGRWPLLLDSWPSLGRSAAAMGVQTIAEGALAAAPCALAIAVVRRGRIARAAWWVSAVAGIVVAAVLAFAPEHLAIISLWASGVTMSLPAFIYVIAAASVGLVLFAWLAQPSTRHLAAAVVLVAVAGITPAVVHHNLTALVGLVLLTTTSWPGVRAATVERS